LLRKVHKFVTSDAAAQHCSSHLPPPQPQISDIKIEAQYRNVDKLQTGIAVREFFYSDELRSLTPFGLAHRDCTPAPLYLRGSLSDHTL